MQTYVTLETALTVGIIVSGALCILSYWLGTRCPHCAERRRRQSLAECWPEREGVQD